jgi:hypothetical protein
VWLKWKSVGPEFKTPLPPKKKKTKPKNPPHKMKKEISNYVTYSDRWWYT